MNCAPCNIIIPNNSESMCRFNECLHCECDSDVLFYRQLARSLFPYSSNSVFRG